MGLVGRFVDGVRAERGSDVLSDKDRGYLEVRIYPNNGSGYFFTQGKRARRWYWQEQAGADHCNRAEVEDVADLLGDGVKVQVCGGRGESYGVWDSWGEFEEKLKAESR